MRVYLTLRIWHKPNINLSGFAKEFFANGDFTQGGQQFFQILFGKLIEAKASYAMGIGFIWCMISGLDRVKMLRSALDVPSRIIRLTAFQTQLYGCNAPRLNSADAPAGVLSS
jgi:hypothetical protein